MKIGEALRQERLRLNLSQSQMAGGCININKLKGLCYMCLGEI